MKGYSSREICDKINEEGFVRRNKKDSYKVKDVYMCIKKLKLREKRKTDTKWNIGLWELCLDIGGNTIYNLKD